jgi:hypothetical protein
MRMNICESVHSFYALDSGEPRWLRTLLFLDFDPVLPGWPPEAIAERGGEVHTSATTRAGQSEHFSDVRVAEC